MTGLILSVATAPASVWDSWQPPDGVQVTRLEIPNEMVGQFTAPGTYYTAPQPIENDNLNLLGIQEGQFLYRRPSAIFRND